MNEPGPDFTVTSDEAEVRNPKSEIRNPKLEIENPNRVQTSDIRVSNMSRFGFRISDSSLLQSRYDMAIRVPVLRSRASPTAPGSHPARTRTRAHSPLWPISSAASSRSPKKWNPSSASAPSTPSANPAPPNIGNSKPAAGDALRNPSPKSKSDGSKSKVRKSDVECRLPIPGLVRLRISDLCLSTTRPLPPLHRLPSVPLAEPTRLERLRAEEELLGYPVSGHPLELFPDIAWDTYCPVNRLGEHIGEQIVTCGLVIEQRLFHQATGEPMKFITIADWTGIVETELFAKTYKSYGLNTVRYRVLEITATVEPFENGRGHTLRRPPRR